MGEIDVGVMHWFSFSQRSAEESEVRIMDLDCLHLGDATWLLSTSQSDGNIRVYNQSLYVHNLPSQLNERRFFLYNTGMELGHQPQETTASLATQD
jgi:hypothetical protein